MRQHKPIYFLQAAIEKRNAATQETTGKDQKKLMKKRSQMLHMTLTQQLKQLNIQITCNL